MGKWTKTGNNVYHNEKGESWTNVGGNHWIKSDGTQITNVGNNTYIVGNGFDDTKDDGFIPSIHDSDDNGWGGNDW